MIREDKNLQVLLYKQRNTEAVIRTRRNNKIELIKYKGGKCSQCGYDKPVPTVYHFHHLNPEEKEFTIAQYMSRKLETLKKEVDKCILLCGNCHAEMHDKAYIRSHEETIAKLKSATLEELEIIGRRTRLASISKVCEQCSKEFVTKRSVQRFCSVECTRLFYRKVERPSKEELLALLSNANFVQVAKMFDVTDNTIRKWLK